MEKVHGKSTERYTRGEAEALLWTLSNEYGCISEKALSLLRQVVASGSDSFSRIAMPGIVVLQLPNGSQITYEEPRFLEDDLTRLIDMGLLAIKGYDSNGKPIYGITRNAVRFIEAIDERHAG
jgi:hypothetical protein